MLSGCEEKMKRKKIKKLEKLKWKFNIMWCKKY